MILIFYFNLNYIYEVIKQRIEQEKLSSQMQKSASKGKFSRIKDTGLLSSEEDNDIMSAVTSKQPPSKKTKRSLTTPATHVSLCTMSSTQSQLPQSSSSIAHVVLNKAPVANKTPPISIVQDVSNEATLTHILPPNQTNQGASLFSQNLPPIVVSNNVSDALAFQNLLTSLQAQQAQIETLTQRVAQVGCNQGAGNRDARFVIIGKDGTSKHMIDEIFGRNFIKWLLAVVKFRFTEKELIENTLEPTARSKRGHLNVEAVALLREALIAKYNYDAEKLDKVWSAVKQAVNNKGRNLLLKQRGRAIFAQVGNSVNGIVRSISSMSMGSNEA